MLDELAVLQAEYIYDRRSIRVQPIHSIDVQHHVVAFGNNAFDLDLQIRIRAREIGESGFEAFVTIFRRWLVLGVTCPCICSTENHKETVKLYYDSATTPYMLASNPKDRHHL